MSSETHNKARVAPELQTVFNRIDQDEKIDNWFKGGLLIAIVVLFIFGSIVLLR